MGRPYNALGPDLPPGADEVRFSPDGTLVAVGGNAPALVDARTHRLLAGLRIAKDRYVSALRFSPDGRTLFAVLGFSTLTTIPAPASSVSTRAPAAHWAPSGSSLAGRSTSSSWSPTMVGEW